MTMMKNTPDIFQSTPPSLAETSTGCGWCLFKWISIHSAIASGDIEAGTSFNQVNIFQSTPPSLAETKLPYALVSVLKISIHSAIASGDRLIKYG